MKRKTRLRSLALVATTCFALAACVPNSGGGSEDGTVNLDLSYHIPAQHPQGEAMERFAEQVGEASDGAIQVNTFPNAQLYDETELVEALPAGSVDMGLINVVGWSGSIPTTQLFDIPFLFEDVDEVHENIDGELGEMLAEQFEEKGVIPIAWIDYEFLQIASKDEPYPRPEDAEGKRIRTASALVAEAVQMAGASSVTMSGSEAYTALERGTVDAALSGMTSFDDRAYYEVSDHVTELDLVYNMFAIAVSKSAWDTLSDDQRDLILEVAQATQEWQREHQANAIEEARKNIQAEGMEIYETSPAERAEWQEAMSGVVDVYLQETGEAGQQMLDAVESN